MKFKNIDEILEFAIENEKEASEFYTSLSKMKLSSVAKKVFEEFAEIERKHQTMLEAFVADKSKIEEFRYKWIPDLKRSNYTTDIEYTEDMAYHDILRLAMKREENAVKLYNDLAAEVDKPGFVSLFRLLAQEEAGHKLSIETIYDDYMAEQGD